MTCPYCASYNPLVGFCPTCGHWPITSSTITNGVITASGIRNGVISVDWRKGPEEDNGRDEGTGGVREPRRPKDAPPSLSVAL